MKFAATLPFLATALQISCSSTTPPATLELPESLRIASIQVVGSTQRWSAENPADNISLPLPCDSQTPLLVSTNPVPDPTTSNIGNFTIAVPGNCGTLVSCGWFTLRIIPAEGAEIDVSTAVSPITANGVTQAGTHDFALELHDATDAVLKGADGKPFGDQVSIEFTSPPDCPVPNESDAGA